MPHQVHLRSLGRKSGHRRGMLRNLTAAVLRYERVRTTEAKAKEVRRLVDRAIGLGRDGGLLARRRARALLGDPLVVEKVFVELAPRYADRPGGYARLVRLGHRVGDGAPMVLVELVEGRELTAAEPPAAEKAGAAEPSRADRAREIARRVTKDSGRKRSARGERKAAGAGSGKSASTRDEKKTEKKETSASRRGKEKSERP